MNFHGWPLDHTETGILIGVALAVVGWLLVAIGRVVEWFRDRT